MHVTSEYQQCPLIPKVKLPRVALPLQTPKTPKFVKPLDGKRYLRMLAGVFLTLLDKWGHPQPGKPCIDSQPASTERPVATMVLPWQLVLKRSGEPKPAKSARKDTSTSFKRTLPCCLMSPLAVYAKTFSSSSIRDRFSKSAYWPKDYWTEMGFEIRSRKWKQKDKFAHEKWGKFMETKQACGAPRIDLELSWSEDLSRLATLSGAVGYISLPSTMYTAIIDRQDICWVRFAWRDARPPLFFPTTKWRKNSLNSVTVHL